VCLKVLGTKMGDGSDEAPATSGRQAYHSPSPDSLGCTGRTSLRVDNAGAAVSQSARPAAGWLVWEQFLIPTRFPFDRLQAGLRRNWPNDGHALRTAGKPAGGHSISRCLLPGVFSPGAPPAKNGGAFLINVRPQWIGNQLIVLFTLSRKVIPLAW
jgi:hypothetical protein